MVIGYLAVVGLSILFRKWIGLELANLFQFGYLSLLINEAITLHHEPISDWSNIFGYNGYHFSPAPG